MAKIPPRFSFGSEPAWVDRAREVFDVPPLGMLYDPSKKHPNVKPDPGDEGRYLRSFLIGGMAVAVSLTPREYLQIAERHFSLLEAAGIHIPDREYHLDGISYGSPSRHARLYTSVAKVHGQRLLDIEEPQRRELVGSLFESLDSYFRQTRDEGERFALAELSYLRQYHLGKTTGDESDRLYLHDLDPYFLDPTDERDIGWWQREQGLFRSLAEYVGGSITDDPMER